MINNVENGLLIIIHYFDATVVTNVSKEDLVIFES